MTACFVVVNSYSVCSESLQCGPRQRGKARVSRKYTYTCIVYNYIYIILDIRCFFYGFPLVGCNPVADAATAQVPSSKCTASAAGLRRAADVASTSS